MKTLVKRGRPMKRESIVEEALMEIQSLADTGILYANTQVPNPELRKAVRSMFHRIVRNAFVAQSANRGEKTATHEFNRHIEELLGHEALN